MTDSASSVTRIVVAAAWLIEESKVLVSRRHLHSSFGGYWEFPGGKVELDEDPRDALRRELREELGIDVRVGRVQQTVLDRRGKHNVLLLFYQCERTDRTEPEALQVLEWKWANWRDLEQLRFPPADRAVLPDLRRELEGTAS